MVWREFSRVERVSSDMVSSGSSRRFDRVLGDVDELGVCRYACCIVGEFSRQVQEVQRYIKEPDQVDGLQKIP